MINLTWRESRKVLIDDCKLYLALYDVYVNYIGRTNASIDEIIEGIQNHIKNYIEELIRYAAPYDCFVGDIDTEDITDLVTENKFLEKFKEWYLNN